MAVWRVRSLLYEAISEMEILVCQGRGYHDIVSPGSAGYRIENQCCLMKRRRGVNLLAARKRVSVPDPFQVLSSR